MSASSLFPMVVRLSLIGIAACAALSCREEVFVLDPASLEDGGGQTPCDGSYGTTFFVRPDGGDPAACSGLVDAPYSSAVKDRQCALSNPMYALPANGETLLESGDRLVIAAGEYEIGADAETALGDGAADPIESSLCSEMDVATCGLDNVPAGLGEQQPTCIVGEGFDTGCSGGPKVVLKGISGVHGIIRLSDTEYVTVGCVELTDGSDCISNNSASVCGESDGTEASPAEFAVVGIDSQLTHDIRIEDVIARGLAEYGISARFASNWTLADVVAEANGTAGLKFGTDGGETETWGRMEFHRVKAAWNGCSASPLGEGGANCMESVEGGTGELGAGATILNTDANWVLSECDFSHNLGIGLSLGRVSEGGMTEIERLRAEGNAGHQLHLSDIALVANSALVSNCRFFEMASPDMDIQSCVAGGAALALSGGTLADIDIVNSTLYSEGLALFETTQLDDYTVPMQLELVNAIVLIGGEESVLWTAEPSIDFSFIAQKSLFDGSADPGDACAVNGNLCTASGLLPIDSKEEENTLLLVPGAESPALDVGLSSGEDPRVPSVDLLGTARPQGAGVDLGALERAAPKK